MESNGPSSLPANAYLIPHADRLKHDPARGWYFTVLVRATFAKMTPAGSP